MNIFKNIKKFFSKKKKVKEQEDSISESNKDLMYCILKLVTGEEILSIIMNDVDDDGNPIIILQNPVILSLVSNRNKLTIKVKPWIENSTDDLFIIKPDHVITISEANDLNLIGMYNTYISLENDDNTDYKNSGKVKPSKKMGYITSVEDAREHLENIFKSL